MNVHEKHENKALFVFFLDNKCFQSIRCFYLRVMRNYVLDTVMNLKRQELFC